MFLQLLHHPKSDPSPPAIVPSTHQAASFVPVVFDLALALEINGDVVVVSWDPPGNYPAPETNITISPPLENGPSVPKRVSLAKHFSGAIILLVSVGV